jgi:hypothetical protein
VKLRRIPTPHTAEAIERTAPGGVKQIDDGSLKSRSAQRQLFLWDEWAKSDPATLRYGTL